MTVPTDALAPVIDGDRAEDVLLHGSQGVGKTVLTRAALDRLDRQQPTPSAHVHCLGASTAGIVRAILRELPGPDPARTTPRDELIATLQERVTEPTVVVLDEGDDLPETDILDVLRRVPDISWTAIVDLTESDPRCCQPDSRPSRRSDRREGLSEGIDT